MNKLAIAVIASFTSIMAHAGAQMPVMPPVNADEPGVMSLMLVSAVIVAAIRLQNKFKKYSKL